MTAFAVDSSEVHGRAEMTVATCESCSRGAVVTLAFPDTTFTLCLRCVPVERLDQVQSLPGREQLVEVMLDRLSAAGPPAVAARSTTR